MFSSIAPTFGKCTSIVPSSPGSVPTKHSCQLRRAVTSVEANIVEGYALGTPPLFRRHLRIAMGSAAEAECLTRAGGELQYLPGDVVRELERLLERTMAAVHGLLRALIRTGN